MMRESFVKSRQENDINQSINQSVLFQAAWPIERETAKQT